MNVLDISTTEVSNDSRGKVKLHTEHGLVIGFIVGHEITHGFDELRRHVDGNGKSYTLWSQNTNDMFDQRSNCILEQYNNYTIPQTGLQVGRCDSSISTNFL